jgi:septum formation protein
MKDPGRKIILGSASPRRQQLMKELFPALEVRVKNSAEDFPSMLAEAEIPVYLAGKKADAFNGELKPGEVLVTADTIVWFNNHVLNKPLSRDDAHDMLKKLNGSAHKVFTGVCLASAHKRKVFSVASSVQFRKVSEADLLDYVDQYQPFDKAGAYGAQECLPAGMNPLSEKEKKFLVRAGMPDLFERSLAVKKHAPIALIEKIDGSYFNVMGLPVVELAEMLAAEFREEA